MTAVIAPSNGASMRFAEKLGFELAGSSRGRLVYARTSVRHLADELGRLEASNETDTKQPERPKQREPKRAQ